MLILDEVQTGICRLGPLFGYELYSIEPDIITLAKGLGSGIPVGAVLAKEHAAVFVPGDHNSTFGGNPVTSAAACAVLKYIIDHDLPAHVNEVSKYLFGKLEGLKEKYSFITEVRGRGLLVAVAFQSDIAEDILMACLHQGLLVNRVKPDAIRLVPPLIIEKKEVDQAVSILDDVLSGVVI